MQGETVNSNKDDKKQDNVVEIRTECWECLCQNMDRARIIYDYELKTYMVCFVDEEEEIRVCPITPIPKNHICEREAKTDAKIMLE